MFVLKNKVKCVKLGVLSASVVCSSAFMSDAYAGFYIGAGAGQSLSSSFSANNTGSATTHVDDYGVICDMPVTLPDGTVVPSLCSSSAATDGIIIKWADGDDETWDANGTSALMFSVSAGYGLGIQKNVPVRFEVEYFQSSIDLDDNTLFEVSSSVDDIIYSIAYEGGMMNVSGIMANAYVGYEVEKFVPYIGVGIGMVTNSVEVIQTMKSSGMGFQFMVGVEYPVWKGLFVGAEYRNVSSSADIADLPSGGSGTGDTNMSSVLLKVRYDFSYAESQKPKRRPTSKKGQKRRRPPQQQRQQQQPRRQAGY